LEIFIAPIAEILAVGGWHLGFITTDDLRRHRELQFDAIVLAPAPGDFDKALVVARGRHCGIIHGDPGIGAPSGNAQIERERSSVRWIHRHADRFVKWIVSGRADCHRHVVASQRGERARPVQGRGQTIVVRRHPHVKDVVGDDAVDRADTTQHLGTTQLVKQDATCSRTVRLWRGQGVGAKPVRRLIVGHGLEVAGDWGGPGVEECAFHAVAPLAVAADAIQPR